MMTVTIKIENSNLPKARTEVEALLVYIAELEKTYPSADAPKAEAPKKTTTRKPRKPKVDVKATAEVEKVDPEDIPEPVKAPEIPEEDDPQLITLEALTALGKEVVKAGKRDEAKALIGKYSSSGKLSSVPADKYDELAVALKAL